MMKRTHFQCLMLVAATIVATACAFEHHTTGLSPSSLNAGGGGSSGTASGSGSMIGVWSSQSIASLPSAANCGNFQWQIGSQSASSVSGTFSALCAGDLTVSGSASGQLSGTNVPFTVTGSASGPGLPSCGFSVSGTGAVSNGDTLTLPYSGITCLGAVHGTETLHRHTNAAAPPPPPPPPPPPSPPPPPPPSGGPSDAIDLHQVTILNSPADVADWPATATLTALDLRANGAHVEHTKQSSPGSWPDITPPGWSGPLQYTLWIVLNVNGRWYGSGCVEYWRGLDQNGGPPSQYSQNWYYDPGRWSPMTGHQPVPGELVGFLVTSGDERNNGLTSVRERSQVVTVAFPDSNGGSFSFANRRGPRLSFPPR
jgi:hypothetical protein